MTLNKALRRVETYLVEDGWSLNKMTGLTIMVAAKKVLRLIHKANALNFDDFIDEDFITELVDDLVLSIVDYDKVMRGSEE